jgi:hypothetical protein
MLGESGRDFCVVRMGPLRDEFIASGTKAKMAPFALPTFSVPKMNESTAELQNLCKIFMNDLLIFPAATADF